MLKYNPVLKSFFIFLIIILLISQASAVPKADKNQKISHHILKSVHNAGEPEPLSEKKEVKAIVYLEDADSSIILEGYAHIEAESGNIVQVSTSAKKLKEISGFPFVDYIRKPRSPHNNVVNEGVLRMEAQKLHALGVRGNGVKIAVLDSGFKDYQSRIGIELPGNLITRSFRADRDISAGEVHGTAVAEIVYDVAPEARMYLVNFDTELEFREAVNWLITQRVDIITQSLGWTAGPFDGTGFIDDIVKTALDSGIVWVNSAGNYAQKHWEGSYSDTDGDTLHEFAGSDEFQDINAHAGDLIEVTLSWNDWTRASQDYELYLYDRNGGIVAGSVEPQAGRRGHEPVESIEYVANYTGVYKIGIKKFSATRNVFFELYSSTHALEYRVASSSLAIPSDVSGVIAVGATDWFDDSLEPFSSQGPTNDGRIKPDLVAPDGVSTATYGTTSFFGTSASAPNLAGTAALLKSAANLSANNVKASLEAGALDIGIAGKDNLYGAGRVGIYGAYRQATPPRIDMLSPKGQVFNINDTILIFGSSNRAFEPVNITINGTNYALNMGTTTLEDGSWGVPLATSNLSSGNYSVNASISFANASSSLVLVTRSLVLNIIPSSLLSGIAGSVNASVRDMTDNPVSGAIVTLRGDRITLSTITDRNGNVFFFVTAGFGTAGGQLNITATKNGYDSAAVNITLKRLVALNVPPFVLMKVTEVKNFTSIGIDEDGVPHIIRAAWTGGNISVGLIDTNGTFEAAGAGITNITASFGDLSSTAIVSVGNTSNGTLARILPSGVRPNENFTVTLVPSAPELFSTYRVVENIPFMNPAINGTLTITGVDGGNVTYNLTAPLTNGTFLFTGRFEDKNRDIGDISQAAVLVVGNPVLRYDFNGNGRIERGEAVEAVMDYFSGAITKPEAIDVVIAFFSG